MEFSELPIPEPVMAGVRDCGFKTCTPIQALTLPPTLAGKDVAGQAQTGTGKTAAFLIAAYSRLLGSGNVTPPDAGCSQPRVLIIAPTRELVVQVEQDAIALGSHTGFRIAAVYGGVDYDKQRETLQQDRIDVLIGTPGRLIDYFKQKAYVISAVEVLVIDEADRMFDMGFIADLRYLLRRLPSYEKRLSMLFSATLSYRAQELSYEYMAMPEVLAVQSSVRTADQVRQILYHVESTTKISLLVGVLRKELEEVSEGVSGGRVMIFVNTKRMGERLQEWLMINEIRAGYLSGDVPQIKRLKVLKKFQQGELPVLIATDVAGRGLHIEGITHVINFDLPENAEDYVHRIGRTARAGAEGDAISLVDEEGAYRLEAIEAFVGMQIPVGWAEEDLFADLVMPPRRKRTGPETAPDRRREKRGDGPRRPSPRKREDAPRRKPAAAPQAETAVAPAPPREGEQPPRRKRRRKRAPQTADRQGSGPAAGPAPAQADGATGTGGADQGDQ
ncbi:MAG: DEAD/DEAH box helicase [Magnetococcales bacterium]|nr:DEAD/DEAH box helicase [Magnetococcales bacterium]